PMHFDRLQQMQVTVSQPGSAPEVARRLSFGSRRRSSAAANSPSVDLRLPARQSVWKRISLRQERQLGRRFFRCAANTEFYRGKNIQRPPLQQSEGPPRRRIRATL